MQVVCEHREEGDVTVLELPRLGKHLVESTEDNRVHPIELAEELEHLVDRLLRQDVEDQMPDEQLDRRALLDSARRAFRRIALNAMSIVSSINTATKPHT